MANPTDAPPPRPSRFARRRFAGVRRALGRTAAAGWATGAPLLWLLAGCGLLLVAGHPDRPWFGPPEISTVSTATGGRGADWKAPLSAELKFAPAARLGAALRTGGLRMILAGPPRAFETDPKRRGFAPPYPDRAWDPGWGVAASSYANVGAPGEAQRVVYLRIGGLFLAAFAPAFAAVWWGVAYGLKVRRERRGEPARADRRPGRFDLLRGAARPWILLAAVAGLATVTTPLATLAGYGSGADRRVSASIGPPNRIAVPDGETTSGLKFGVGWNAPAPRPPVPAGPFGARLFPRVPGASMSAVERRDDRTLGSGGWCVGLADWDITFGGGGGYGGREAFVGPWWLILAGALGSLAAAYRWRRDRAKLPASALSDSP